MDDLLDACLTYFKNKYDFKAATHLHISLSKTVVLQYHFIESFKKNLEEVLTSIYRYSNCIFFFLISIYNVVLIVDILKISALPSP